jgi:putative spermidine/putrescine transport system ATP-binding protein
MPDPLLSVTALRKQYGDVVAVDSLSFEVERGEFFTLLGPSGCGKSTTLMSLVGFEAIDGGRIELDGRDVTSVPPEGRGMGVVFQNYALFPHMNVLENVMFPLRMRGTSAERAEERARATLELVQLDQYSARPSEISGGQMQRVALARALVFDPPILLMDEPLAALDRRLRQTMQFELRRIQDQVGTTVIYVTHDQEEALVLSDRIAVMRAGRFEQVAPPREIYEQPVNAFVANFLGESNRLRVRVVSTDDAGALVESVADPSYRMHVSTAPPTFQAGTLIVRPEHVHVEWHSRQPAAPSVPGIVVDRAFLGSGTRLELRLLEETWTAMVPASVDEGALPEIGQQVNLTWSPGDARLVDAEP